MQANSHLELAEYLLSVCAAPTAPAQRAAFLFGSIEPDLNCTTYLKGLLHGSGVHGHNYTQVMPRIERLLDELSGIEKDGVLAWYRLGKLLHFIADAFTFPHNSCFSGGLSEHMRYEAQLAVYFRWTLHGSAPMPARQDSRLLYAMIEAQHERYLKESMGKENDARFILSVTCAVFAALTADAPTGVPAALTGGAMQ